MLRDGFVLCLPQPAPHALDGMDVRASHSSWAGRLASVAALGIQVVPPGLLTGCEEQAYRKGPGL